MRIGWICALAACVAALGLARGETPRAAYAAISGVVLNDATGAPIRRVVVTLSTLGDPALEAVTFSESNGAFGFTVIPPGRYQLSASLDGFERTWFGATTRARAPGTLTLAGGDLRHGITFRLRPVGSVSGTAFDPEGDPIPNVQVRLLKAGWSRSKPFYQNQAYAMTDDRGRYHFSDVVADRYIVMAAQPYGTALVTRPEAAAGQAQSEKKYAAQFYPDAGRLSAAVPIQTVPGKDLDGIDFHLTPRAVASLRGKVVAPADLPANASVGISVYVQDVMNYGDQCAGSGAFAPNFEFYIPNLIAAPYLVEANMSVEGREYLAVERIELPPGGEEIALHLERAIDLEGRVDLEGGDGTAHLFTVMLAPGGDPAGRSPIRAETQPDGTFVAHNVTPGVWDIDVEPVPPGGYIKSMRLGDQDVLTEDMTIDSGTRAPLRIVVSTRGAVVSGTVTVPHGMARSARARVLLAPAGKYARVLSFYAENSADESGHFEIKGVTPGRYKVYAFEEMEPAAYDDPDFLKPFEKWSAAFDVAEGARVERQTQLIVAGTGSAGRE